MTDMTQEILDIIRAGDVDDSLKEIEDAVFARRALKGGQKLASDAFVVGKTVEVVGKLKPNYLFGHRFEIQKVNDKTVVISVPNERIYRRFAGSRSVRIPKTAVKVVA
jgi:hypothetical protein